MNILKLYELRFHVTAAAAILDTDPALLNTNGDASEIGVELASPHLIGALEILEHYDLGYAGGVLVSYLSLVSQGLNNKKYPEHGRREVVSGIRGAVVLTDGLLGGATFISGAN